MRVFKRVRLAGDLVHSSLGDEIAEHVIGKARGVQRLEVCRRVLFRICCIDHLELRRFDQLVEFVVAVAVVMGSGALFDQATYCIANELGAK